MWYSKTKDTERRWNSETTSHVAISNIKPVGYRWPVGYSWTVASRAARKSGQFWLRKQKQGHHEFYDEQVERSIGLDYSSTGYSVNGNCVKRSTAASHIGKELHQTLRNVPFCLPESKWWQVSGCIDNLWVDGIIWQLPQWDVWCSHKTLLQNCIFHQGHPLY